MNRIRLSKQTKLLNSKEFFSVFKAKKIIKSNGILLFSRPNQLGFPRIGLAISKKYINRAHDRNTIKRHARETFRILQHNLLNLDFVLTIYSKKILYLKHNNLNEEFKKLWKQHEY
ncbi:ribonuclease P protein component [Candidatus Blochmanniella vafra str. BVAF]|uniref:Ribonuclease P protein component n=1 Tax=Blochmanniella vafra (strain BVAF) TaxID=859654 RepID=E8Q5V8_BLOVB|nr:ribonuclease P protein component [Candidatus Blochmannia vafer]ADV33427.1 ribonuclease P protein component [Candidatus Blochmannia vafer str. BVAF]